MVGRTTLVYTAMGGIFASVEDTMSSLRDGRKDIWNGAVAGCAAGMVFGVNCTCAGGRRWSCMRGAGGRLGVASVGVDGGAWLEGGGEQTL